MITIFILAIIENILGVGKLLCTINLLILVLESVKVNCFDITYYEEVGSHGERKKASKFMQSQEI